MKFYMRFFWIIVFVYLNTLWVSSQQDPHFTKYMYRNQSLYNPSATGRMGDFHSGLTYRIQWLGIDGAPSTLAGNFEKSLDKGNAGIGFNFFYDKIGFDQNLALQINYAYRIKLSNESVLSFGIKGGANLIYSDFSNAVTPEFTDPLHSRNNIWIPRMGIGLMYHNSRFFIAASVPSLLAYIPEKSFQLNNDGGFLSHHFYGSMGYVIDLKKDIWQLKPFIFAKYHHTAPFQLDLGLQLWYKNVFSIGSSYRTGDAIAAMLEIPVWEGINLSYAYDYTNSLFREIGSGAHEIVIEYTWNKKKTKVPSIHKITNLPKF